MVSQDKYQELKQGSNCREQFRAAYENRYTWAPGFKGYIGDCLYENENDITYFYRFEGLRR